jgi:hypothetical protein
MYVYGQRLQTFPCKISNLKKFTYFINNKPIFPKFRIFTNFNTVFPVVVFDFEEFSEEVLHGHCMHTSQELKI